eukprot:m.272851 g.272851  ORF g.272851 m.272851 type:complete len:259 (+) comp19334_c0_seq3:164-940(+)
MTEQRAKFKFSADNKGLSSLTTKEHQENLAKWSLGETIRGKVFRFDQPFQEYELQQLVLDFFSDPIVLSELQVLHSKHGSWGPLGQQATGVDFDPVPCTQLSMEFFDRLYECGVLRADGAIKGCIPEYVEGLAINNELEKAMFMEDSDNHDVFSPDERSQLLFRLFMLLIKGGPLNQYEDNIGAYFDMTKLLYKDLVSVSKDPQTKSLFVNSSVVSINSVEGLCPLFPEPDHPQNCLFLVVCPTTRAVRVLYNAWVGD